MELEFQSSVFRSERGGLAPGRDETHGPPRVAFLNCGDTSRHYYFHIEYFYSYHALKYEAVLRAVVRSALACYQIP